MDGCPLWTQLGYLTIAVHPPKTAPTALLLARDRITCAQRLSCIIHIPLIIQRKPFSDAKTLPNSNRNSFGAAELGWGNSIFTLIWEL